MHRGARARKGVLYSDLNDYMMTMTPAHQHADSAFDLKMVHFVDGISKGVPCLAPASDGVRIQKIIEGICRSAELGKEAAHD
jgi:hypothetical protein